MRTQYTPRIPLVCQECGNTYLQIPSHVWYSKFCSRHCRDAFGKKDPVVRFWSKVDRRGDDECWEWQGRRDKNGYGRFSLRHGFSVGAHRYSWEQTNGPIPKGAMILHSCDNPPCNNPRHLSPGNASQNAKQMVERGRGLTGERMPKHKVTEEDVRQIRELAKQGQLTLQQIGDVFGIGELQVYRIKHRKAWAHV